MKLPFRELARPAVAACLAVGILSFLWKDPARELSREREPLPEIALARPRHPALQEQKARSLDPGPKMHPSPRGLFSPLGPGLSGNLQGAPGRLEPPSGAPPRAPLPGSGSAPPAGGPLEVLSGQVVRPDGAPIAGASVALASSACITGADGRFALPRSSGNLKVFHPDFFQREIDAETLRSTPLVLRPGSRITGAVTDSGGRPVAGARVAFGRSECPLEALTGKDGRYESPLVPPGPVSVFVTHPEFQPAEGTVQVKLPRAQWDVNVHPGRRFAVHVISFEGTPLSDAEVWAEGPSNPAGSSPAGRFLGRTGDQGSLETRIEPGRDARLRVRLPGFQEATEEAKGEAVRFQLAPAPFAQGYGVDASSGLPLKLTRVKLEALAGAEYQEAPEHGCLFQSFAQGKFLVGLPPQAGTYRVSVEAEGSFFGRSEQLSCDGKASPPPFIVRLEPRLELRGLVEGPEGALAGVTVELLCLERREGSPRRIFGALLPAPHSTAAATKSGQEGRFSFKGARLGVYRLHVKTDRLGEYLSPPIQLPWEGEYPVFLRRGQELSGALIDSEGLPEPDIPILLACEDGTACVSWTDGEGLFLFRGLSPGDRYQLIVGDPTSPALEVMEEGSGLVPERGPLVSRRVTIEEGKDLVYNLRRPPSARGSLEGKLEIDGQPAAGAVIHLVRLTEPGMEKQGSEPVLTDGKGEFLRRGLLPGGYRIEGADIPVSRDVSVEEGHRARVAISLKSVGLKLKLVERQTGQPYSRDALVELVEVSPSRGERVRRRGAPEAQHEWQGLFPGSYLLRVKVKQVLFHEEQLDLFEDREEVIAVDQGSDLSVRLVTPEEEAFRGEAEVVLIRGGREIYRVVEEVMEAVSVCLPGTGEYELVVRSGEQVARKKFRLGPGGQDELEKSPPREDNKEPSSPETNQDPD